MKTKTFDVYCDVYGVNLFVVLGMDSEGLNKLLKRKFGIDKDAEYQKTEGHVGGCVLEFSKWPYQVLWLDKKSLNSNDLIPKIAHEVFHHVLRVCQKKQIPTYPNIDNLIMDEAASYLMEFYMREILKKMKQKKPRK